MVTLASPARSAEDPRSRAGPQHRRLCLTKDRRGKSHLGIRKQRRDGRAGGRGCKGLSCLASAAWDPRGDADLRLVEVVVLPQIGSLGQRLPQQQDGPTPCPPQGRAPRAQAWPSSQTLGDSSEFFELPVLDPNYGVWGGSKSEWRLPLSVLCVCHSGQRGGRTLCPTVITTFEQLRLDLLATRLAGAPLVTNGSNFRHPRSIPSNRGKSQQIKLMQHSKTAPNPTNECV